MLKRLNTCWKSILAIIAPLSMGLLGLAIILLATPPSVFGQQSQNNTAVFSGQVIPAFIGTAYDPSEAYQRLAGLPVYVFAYDSWGGGNFILNNLAVRTQIRLDGSFQAQGLPSGSNYGVYFPFIFQGGNTSRIDCPDAANGNQGPCAGTIQGAEVQFRMPQENNADLIQDVFSYNMSTPGGSARAVCGVRTQIQGETVCLGPSFLTNETRVDIANNINTFPLVPTNTLKITTKVLCHFLNNCLESTTSAYEVVAQRVVETGAFLRPIESPIIRGRSTFPLKAAHDTDNPSANNRIFQAYAPPGVYAITVWRADGSTIYSNYSPNGSTNSALTGFAILRINNNDDWSIALTKHHRIPLRTQQFTIWGRTHTLSTGSPVTGDIFVNMTNANFNSILHSPKMRTEGCGELFWTQPIGGANNMYPGSCGSDGTSGGPDPVGQSFGLYAFYDSAAINFTAPRTNSFEVYVDTTGYLKRTESTEQIFTNEGPRRLDMVAALENTGAGGITLQVDPPPVSINTGADSTNKSGTRLFAVRATRTAGADSDVIEIPASGKNYSADMLGLIHIPQADLQPRSGEGSYFLRFLIKHPYSELYAGYDDNPIEYTGAYLNIGPIQLDSLALVSKPEPYKLLGFIPVSFLLPRTPEILADESADHAHLTISFSGSNNYQSVKLLNNAGKIVDTVPESLLSNARGEWTYVWTLPYSGPRTRCEGTSMVVLEACQNDIDRMNTYTVASTADNFVQSQTFRVRYSPSQGVASAVPSSHNFNFANECVQMEKTLNEQFTAMTDAEKAARLANASGTWEKTGAYIANALSGIMDFRKIQEVNVPVFGCNVSLTVSKVMSAGLQTIQTVLIMDPLTTSLPVIKAWEVIRGMANFFFIFILLIIGVNQILGFDRQTWATNAMMPQLILGIILANTSLLLVQFVLDINNILTSWIFSIIFNVLESSGISANAVAGVGVAGASVATFAFLSTVMSAGIAGAVTSILGTGGTILIPLLGAILVGVLALVSMAIVILATLYGRYLIIWILTIVAPIIFAISVLPWGRGIRNTWWKTVVPISAIQTFVAILLSIGILLMSRGVEADGILQQAGVFLIGGATLAMTTKAPQLAVQFLGAGGMAAAALGAVTAAGSKLGGMTQSVGQGIGGTLSREGIEGREEQRAMLRGMGISTSRIPGFNAVKAGVAQSKINTVSRVERLGKLETTATDSAIGLQKVQSVQEESMAAGRPVSLRQAAEKRFEDEYRPDLEIRRAHNLSQVQLDAFKAGSNIHWYDNDQKYRMFDKDLKTEVDLSIPELKLNVAETVAANNRVDEVKLKAALAKATTIDKIVPALAKEGFGEDIGNEVKSLFIQRLNKSNKENLQGAIDPSTGNAISENISRFFNEGMRQRGILKQAEGVKIPEASDKK